MCGILGKWQPDITCRQNTDQFRQYLTPSFAFPTLKSEKLVINNDFTKKIRFCRITGKNSLRFFKYCRLMVWYHHRRGRRPGREKGPGKRNNNLGFSLLCRHFFITLIRGPLIRRAGRQNPWGLRAVEKNGLHYTPGFLPSKEMCCPLQFPKKTRTFFVSQATEKCIFFFELLFRRATKNPLFLRKYLVVDGGGLFACRGDFFTSSSFSGK